jgi:hypothetical protein
VEGGEGKGGGDDHDGISGMPTRDIQLEGDDHDHDREGIAGMPTRDIQLELESYGVDPRGSVERRDLEAQLAEARHTALTANPHLRTVRVSGHHEGSPYLESDVRGRDCFLTRVADGEV